MTRDEVFHYRINDAGVITSPGKFEGNMLYVPAFWERGLDGASDFDCGTVYGFVFDDDDRKEFPEIGDSYGMLLEESENGFVNAVEPTDQKSYDVLVARVEAAQESDDEA
jgi:hypothetical protein